MASVNQVFKSLQWVLLIFATVTGALGIMYVNPDEQTAFLRSFGLQVGTPAYDMPVIIPLLGILWIIFLMSQTSYLALKVNSDRVIAEGMDRTESCTASRLHQKGDFCFLRIGGTKFLDIRGKTALINPLTHVHRIGNNIVMEAHVTPDTELSDVPTGLKEDILPRTKGFFGVDKCSIGYLSSKEQREHIEFDGSKYEGATGEDKKKKHTTATFILEILTKNRTVDPSFRLFHHDTTPYEEMMASINNMGRASSHPRKRGLLSYIMSDEE